MLQVLEGWRAYLGYGLPCVLMVCLEVSSTRAVIAGMNKHPMTAQGCRSGPACRLGGFVVTPPCPVLVDSSDRTHVALLRAVVPVLLAVVDVGGGGAAGWPAA